MNATFAQTMAFICLIFTLACQGSGKSRAAGSEAKNHKGTSDAAVDFPSEQKPIVSVPIGVADPNARPFTLTPERGHDAVDYTFGVAALNIGDLKEPMKIVTSRAILNGSNQTLSALQKDLFTRLCRDIGISRDATQYIPAESVQKGENLYLMWRSHYSAATTSRLADILSNGGYGIECLLSLNIGGIELNLGFVPSPGKPEGFGGTLNFEKAIYLGLMLPRTFGIQKPNDPNVTVPITDEAKISLWIEPLQTTQLTVAFGKPSVSNDCALVNRIGMTEVANPYAQNQIHFEVSGPSSISLLESRLKTNGGRLLTECQNLKGHSLKQSFRVDVSCGQYQAIKDQGLEAACAWDLVVSNDDDPENTVLLPVQMPKIAYKTVDVREVKDAILLTPRSALNPVRAGQVQLNGFSVNQQGAFEDLFDLWIAVDEEGFRRDFTGQIKKIDFSLINGCLNGAGAYTPYGGDTIFWCANGGVREADVVKRHSDPQLYVYRAMLAYHETRHSKSWKHDSEVKSYKPCEGTAYSAFLAHQIVTQCSYDYCKVMRDGAIQDYKLELNYDYDRDLTGRKSEGLCKTWSSAMGISGGGF